MRWGSRRFSIICSSLITTSAKNIIQYSWWRIYSIQRLDGVRCLYKWEVTQTYIYNSEPVHLNPGKNPTIFAHQSLRYRRVPFLFVKVMARPKQNFNFPSLPQSYNVTLSETLIIDYSKKAACLTTLSVPEF